MTGDLPSPPLLAMRGIQKRFGAALALDRVSLRLARGEVLALMGENGAGKSTLMKVLGGIHSPDAGTLEIDGRPVRIDDVRDARRLGIALIHQELFLAPNLDIAANLFLGNEFLGEPVAGLGWLRPVPEARLHARATELLQRVGLERPASTPVARLTTGQMQLCEIAKALGQNARILVMDEPTASLAAAEADQLFGIIRQLKADGLGIIYISHRLDEVLKLADRISVLRDGCYAGDLAREDASHDAIAALMIGRLDPRNSEQFRPFVRGKIHMRKLMRSAPLPPVPSQSHAG